MLCPAWRAVVWATYPTLLDFVCMRCRCKACLSLPCYDDFAYHPNVQLPRLLGIPVRSGAMHADCSAQSINPANQLRGRGSFQVVQTRTSRQYKRVVPQACYRAEGCQLVISVTGAKQQYPNLCIPVSSTEMCMLHNLANRDPRSKNVQSTLADAASAQQT